MHYFEFVLQNIRDLQNNYINSFVIIGGHESLKISNIMANNINKIKTGNLDVIIASKILTQIQLDKFTSEFALQLFEIIKNCYENIELTTNNNKYVIKKDNVDTIIIIPHDLNIENIIIIAYK